MGRGFFRRLKASAILFIILLFALLIVSQARPADARANLTAYTSATPNSWQMKGFNVSGTAPLFIRSTFGWNQSNMLGNVGIGSGSLRDWNASGNRVINYTEAYYMAGDVSSAPFDRSRLTTVSLTGAGLEPGYRRNVSEERFEQETGENNTTGRIASMRNLEQADGGLEKAGEAAVGTPAAGKDIPLNDPYHTILLGRPIDDMMYQHPHGISTNAYGRLMGLPLPGGTCANIALRIIGYGY